MTCGSSQISRFAVVVGLSLEGDRQLVDRVQHDHRYLAFGLELIVAIGGPKFERLFQSRMRSSPVAVLARAFSFSLFEWSLAPLNVVSFTSRPGGLKA
jgi:hypothetical protein